MVSLRAVTRLIVPTRFELAKLIIVISLVTMAFAGHAIFTLQDSIDDMQTFEEDYDFAMEIMETQSFNQSLNLLSVSVQTGQGSSFLEVVQAMRQSQDSFQTYQQARRNLEQTYQRYQWLFLLGLLGLIAGVTIIFV